jgi:hypothetical protein
VGVRHQVVDVYALAAAADEHLQLGLIEHAHPARLDDLKKAAQERGGGAVHGVVVESEVRQPVDVLSHVVWHDGQLAAAGLELHLCQELRGGGGAAAAACCRC